MSQTDTGNTPDPVVTQPLENNASTTSAPTGDNAGLTQAEIDKKNMEINMLRNKLEAAEKEKQENLRKELEEKEDFRSLAEQERAKREALEKEIADREAREKAAGIKSKVLNEFSSEVREAASDLGIDLDPSAGDEAEAQYRAKLEAIQKRVGTAPAPGANNPKPQAQGDDLQELMKRHVDGDEAAMLEMLKKLPSVQSQLPQNNNQ